MSETQGADWELQVAIVARLASLDELASLVGDPPRIYQRVPPQPLFPYITIGDGHVADSSVQDLAAEDVWPDIHVWSRAQSRSEGKRIAAIVKAALHERQDLLALAENRCVYLRHQATRQLDDPDGTTWHSVVTFKAGMVPA